MKKMWFFLFVVFLFFFNSSNAQSYCLAFSKKDHKAVNIKEGKNISFVLKGTEEWSKGELLKITPDSIVVKEDVVRDYVMSERESSYVIKSYRLEAFRMIAYNTALDTYGKGTVVVLLFVTAVAAMVVSGVGDFPDSSAKNKNSKAQEKFFKKNVNLDKGWNATVVFCED